MFSEDILSATCIAETRVTLLILDREYFNNTFGSLGLLKNPVTISEPQTARIATQSAQSSAKVCLNPVKIALSGIEMLATLGVGAFGRVRLCRCRVDPTQYFSIKCQSKASIVKNSRQADVINEIIITQEVRHPFVARMFTALQDSKYVYILLEFLPGGELLAELKRGPFSETSVIFYVASVLLALAFVHEKNIAFRDLKLVYLSAM